MKNNLHKSKTQKHSKRNSFQPLEGFGDEEEKVDVMRQYNTLKNTSSKPMNGDSVKIVSKPVCVDGSTQHINSGIDQSVSISPNTKDIDVSTIKRIFRDYAQSTDINECKDIDMMTDVVIMKEAEVSTVMKQLKDSSTMTPQNNYIDIPTASAIAQN